MAHCLLMLSVLLMSLGFDDPAGKNERAVPTLRLGGLLNPCSLPAGSRDPLSWAKPTLFSHDCAIHSFTFLQTHLLGLCADEFAARESATPQSPFCEHRACRWSPKCLQGMAWPSNRLGGLQREPYNT